MTKAARIRELYAQGKSTSAIAEIVGCSAGYVRVCARQRGVNAIKVKGCRMAKADIAYYTARHGSMDAYFEWNRARVRERYRQSKRSTAA